MKKILTLMLCLGALGSMSAQKIAVDQAKKLSGKADKLTEARSLIQQAISNDETKNNAETYYVAGKIELDAFDNGFKIKAINPNDPAANGKVMADELLAAYNYFLQALPLDQLPNEKGQVKPKYTKDILNRLAGHANDFFGAGADYYNEKAFYPEAYNAFMIYGDLPSGVLEQYASSFPAEQIATSYFNAGLAASQGQAPEAAAEAFKKARLAGYDKPEATIYEIASWQTIAQQDESRGAEAQENIKAAAQAGIDTFGIENTIFINNLINSMVTEGEIDQAVAKLNDLIAQNPEAANLYGLRGYVYDRAEKDDLSEADYRKASSLPSADFETLKNTSNKLYRIGATKLNDLEGNSPETNAAREDIKVNYFIEAQNLANKANEMQPGDPYIQNILDSIDYALTTFFNN